MKRFIILLITLSILLGCACLSAMADSANGHTHTWKDLPDSQQPTCTEPGWKVQYCAGCGQTRDVRIPALGHEFSQKVYTSYADCTHYGAFYWVCERCGAHSAIGNDKPLGHDWDEGVITTQPHGFTPGVKTYTCRRDPSHTYTEEVDPMGLLFATLEGGITVPDFSGGTADLKDLPPLVITRQPEKGYVTLGGSDSCTLTVEVEGGEPPYTYEWHMVSHMLDSVSDDTLAAISGGASIDASDWSSMMGSLLGGMLPEWTGSTLTIDVSSQVVGGNSPSLEAYWGNSEYWCRITDSKKQSIESDKVTVGYKIHITEQPHNVNLTGVETALLTCKAADGRVENGYTYTWYDKNGTSVGTGSELEMDLEGEYYCVASDGVDSIPSDKATLYIAEPLSVTFDYDYLMLWPEETGTVSAKVSGGVPPYDVRWKWDGGDLPTEANYIDAETVEYSAQTEHEGWYRIFVSDKMDYKVRKSIYRYDRELTISKQPQGGVLLKNLSHPLSVEVEDGEAPFVFVLYHNEEELVRATSSDKNITFNAWEPGEYYFYIYDAKGCHGTSDKVTVERYLFRFEDYTKEAYIQTPGEEVKLHVEPTGGYGSYTYEWTGISYDGHLISLKDRGQNAFASIPGKYYCKVTDDARMTIKTSAISVSYAGKTPWITKQPENRVVVRYQKSDIYYFSASCYALSGSGDDSNLTYTWKYWNDDHWALYDDTGRIIPIIGPASRRYTCFIEDKVTGGSIQTDILTIAPTIERVSAEVFARRYPNKDEVTYLITFAGGQGPYKIKAYCPWGDQTGDVLIKTVVADGKQDAYYVRIILPMWHDVLTDSGNGMSRQSVPSSYYFVITDSNDTKETTTIISW